MWPKLLDLSREDSKRILRRVELDAYSGVVSAFRAQGDLTKDKKKLLQELQHILSISTERHRAEVRRAVNDEKLTTVADSLSSTNISSEWLIEGRRLIPLMPRLVPQTAFTGLANNAATMQLEKNAIMPSPSSTGCKDAFGQIISVSTPATTPTATVAKVGRPASPTSNVVVLPSGMSIHIKGGLNTEEDDEIRGKKRRRSSSAEGMVALANMARTAGYPMASTAPKLQYSHPGSIVSSSNTIQGITPMKITFTKSPSRSHTTVTPSQKVILVSTNSVANSHSSSVLQKSMSVPVVKSSAVTVTTTTSAHMQPKTSILMPSTSVNSSANGNLGNIGTVATSNNLNAPGTSTSSAIGTSATTLLTSAYSFAKTKPKTVTRQRTPPIQGAQKPGVVIPMGPQSSSNPSLQGIQIKPISNKPTIQIKQEGGMKIITHAISNTPGKLLPKPAQFSHGGSSPVVVVSNSNPSSIAMVTKAISSGSSLAGKVLNITTAGGKVIATTTKTTPNVVTVNPKTLQITGVKTSGTSTPLKMSGHMGNKPNVIVVQKAHPKQVLSLTGQGKASNSPFEKELVSFIQKQDAHKVEKVGGQMINIVPSVVRVEKKIIQKPSIDLTKKVQVRPRSDSDTSGKSSLLAELIHAAGIAPDGGSGSNSGPGTPTISEEIPSSQTPGQQLPLNEWVDYDVNPDDQASAQPQEGLSAIRALLKVHNASGSEQPARQTTVDINQLSQLQLQQGEFLNIDQAASILKQMSQGESSSSSSQNYVQYLQNPSQAEEQQTKVIVMNTTNNNPSQSEVSSELDPQTGLFMPSSGRIKVLEQSDKTEAKTKADGSKQPMDIFSSAIAEAQIDLDTYQFDMDDEENLRKFQSPQVMEMLNQIEGNTIDQPAQQGMVSVLTGSSSSSVVSQANTTLVTSAAPSSQASTTVTSQPNQVATSRPVEVQQGQGDAKQTYITFQEVSQGPNSEVVAIVSRGNVQVIEQPIVARNVAVTVEPSGLDASHMKMEDFTSQRLDSRQEVDDGGFSEEESSSDSQHDVRLSKRKRKPPAAIDDSPPPPPSLGGWVRAALGLLQRVAKYRGTNREKGEINAAAWFLRPVDPNDAPGYYEIVKTPMDFSTIRRKLETGQYSTIEDFHHDMVLIRDNCYLYNPPDHEVRRDCDDVYRFYIPEYERMVDRLRKEPAMYLVPQPNVQTLLQQYDAVEAGMVSPVSKKPRLETKSPIKLVP
ncbi:BRCA2-interacting transcriptional repressor EMSY-like isoform X2 [Lineus longissimus]|uniref:BRCA2-interacting transcriptional repressor EMSY-like isoform X2 n=1 Tax=Lineus longissimus TaxID=88925 RepID=UPI00315DE603